MPNDVKAIGSVIAALVAVIFAFWERANGRTDLFWFVLGFAAFAIVSMWVFAEAVGKKGSRKDT